MDAQVRHLSSASEIDDGCHHDRVYTKASIGAATPRPQITRSCGRQNLRRSRSQRSVNAGQRPVNAKSTFGQRT